MPRTAAGRQQGAALLLLLALLGGMMALLLASRFGGNALQNRKNQQDATALEQARAALIGYAASDANRPGELPCPDATGDGLLKLNEDFFGGGACASYLGRLPWKRLGLPELRDSSGELLWYALSSNFRAGSSAVLNSNAVGMLSVAGASPASQVVAIVFAPGAALAGQVRSAANLNLAAHYLEGDNANGDNSFQTADAQVNDKLLSLGSDQLLAVVEKRVARAALQCLQQYAAQNFDRYPWAAPLVAAAAPSYQDQSGVLFGRIPNNLAQTKLDSGMSDQWPLVAPCNTSLNASWWLNWREATFYAVADAHRPLNPPESAPSGAYLTINPPAPADKKVLVIVAGKMLSGQTRSSNADKSAIANYLEGINATAAATYAHELRSETFNDALAYPQ